MGTRFCLYRTIQWWCVHTAYRLKWSHGLPLISRPGWMSPRYYVTDVRPVMTEWEGGDKTPPPIEEVSVGKEKAVLEGAFTG